MRERHMSMDGIISQYPDSDSTGESKGEIPVYPPETNFGFLLKSISSSTPVQEKRERRASLNKVDLAFRRV
jgi:hypothetical protein